MSAPDRHSRGRARYTAMTLLLVIASTASLLILNAIGQRTAVRVDVTATREHALSPRSRALVDQLRGEYEIVIAGPLKDRRLVDPRSLQRIADVLDQFKRAAPASAAIRPTLIDTGSAAGVETYERLLSRLMERDAAKVNRLHDSVSASIAGTRQLAEGLESLSPRLAAMRDTIPPETPGASTTRAYFEQRAGESASSAKAIRELAGKADAALKSPAASLPIPDFDAAADTLRQPLADMERGLAAIASDLSQIAQAETFPAAARDQARAVAPTASDLRNRAALIRDTLDRLEKLDLLRVARALQSSSAVIVIGPPDQGLTGIDFAELFPPAAAGDIRDAGRNAEELLSSALAALAHPVKPIVVLMHAQTRGFFDKLSFFELMKQRLGLRGIDVVMWEAALDPEPPGLARLNPRADRPVVYLVFNTASHAGGGTGPSGAERASALGRALAKLVEDGKPVLMSVFPSMMPSYGEPDATTAWLRPLGVEVQSGKPLLKERLLPEGRRVEAFQVVRALDGEHPIAGAMRGLPTRLEWPIAMRVNPDRPASTTITSLFVIDDKQAWGESQWLAFMQVPLSQHPGVPNPPSRDAPSDDTAGPWTVALAVERRLPGTDRAQRIVAVGSNTWFSDAVMGEAMHVDGRLVAAYPGNAELLEAGIYWLAGQDSLIAQSATARAAPLIPEMDGATLSALRWLAIAGLPALVLLLGALWRMWRG